MENQCLICNKRYKTYNSLWNHNKKYHKEEIIKKEPVENKPLTKFKCKNCEKNFNNRQSKWRHEKTCKNQVTNEELAEKLSKLEKELEDFKNKPTQTVINNINQGVINKGPVYNFLSKPGSENLNILTQKEIEYIMEQQFNCVVSMIEMLNFNDDLPSNHTFCTTALNDKYISTINPETLEVGKQRKKDFYDSLLWNGINNMKILYDKFQQKNTKKAIIYKKNIDSLVDYLIVSDKGKKTFVELINALTFNKRHIVQATWASLKNNQLPENKRLEYEESSDEESDIPEKKELANNKVTNSKYPKILDFTKSDSEDSESETESETENFIHILYQNKSYILSEDKVYYINFDGSKGKLFGTYSNGRVIKNKIKEFDV